MWGMLFETLVAAPAMRLQMCRDTTLREVSVEGEASWGSPELGTG